MKKPVWTAAALAVLMSSSLLAVADEPEIGWTMDESKVVTEVLTEEEVAAGVTPWILAGGGTWGSLSLDSVKQVGSHTTLDLSKRIQRVKDSTIYKVNSGMKGSLFKSKTTISRLILPDDIAYLAFSSTGSQFESCTGLTEVEPFLPSTMASVPDKCFNGCSALAGDLVLPAAKSVGTYAFYSSKITSATLGNKESSSLTIAKQAFNSCANLESVVINTREGWKTTTTTSGAGDNFKGCTALKNFTMMSFPTEMQATAFATHAAKSTYAANKYKIRFLVPEGIADDQKLLTEGLVKWADCDQAAKDAYAERWPGERPPLGVIKDTQASDANSHYGTYTLPANQFVAYLPDNKKGLMLLVR